VAAAVKACNAIHDLLRVFGQSGDSKVLVGLAAECRKKGANFSEFVAFWPMLDVSHSIFLALDAAEQATFIQRAAPAFLEKRVVDPKAWAFRKESVLAQMDAKAHKKSGALGATKIRSILQAVGFKECVTAKEFLASENAVFLPDLVKKNQGSEYLAILNHFGAKLAWSKNHSDKLPDALAKMGDHLFIVEHKHMKEGGGGQDKQMLELVELVEEGEPNPLVHHVSFLDGIYWNALILPPSEGDDNKGMVTLARIKKALGAAGNTNYFVNTVGFSKLFLTAAPATPGESPTKGKPSASPKTPNLGSFPR
jgi:hypothetical protein